MFFRAFLLSCAVVLGLSAQGFAQIDQSLVGNWKCDYTRIPASKNDPSGREVSISLNLKASSGFTASGTMKSLFNGLKTPVEAQGRWSVDNRSQDESYAVINGRFRDTFGLMVPLFFYGRIVDSKTIRLKETEGGHKISVRCRR